MEDSARTGGGSGGVRGRWLETLIRCCFSGVRCGFMSVGGAGGFYQLFSTRLAKEDSFLSSGLSVNVPRSSKPGQSLP